MPIELIVFALGAVATVIALHQFAQNLRKARLIDDIPTSNIRSAVQGFTELTGRAAYDGKTLYSPASGEPCVWYYIKVEKKDDNWRKIQEHNSSQSFALKDGTGVCYIYPGKKRLAAATQRRWFSSSMYPGEYAPTTLTSHTPYRITEHLIREHDFLYALGDFKTQRMPSPSQMAKEHMKDIIREWKHDYPSLLAKFDRNGDGEIDSEEWQQARKQAYQTALKQAKADHNTEGEHILVPPQHPLPFIVANEDPKRLVKLYQQRMIMSIVGLIACLTMLYFSLY